MSLNELLKTKRAEILEIASRHGARNVRVFGSVARGEATANSDIDFLVELDKQTSLMDHAALVVDLEQLLHHTVDVAPEDSLREKVRARILSEVVPL